MVNSMKSVYITDYLERNAKEMPNKPAVIFNDQILTYEELLQKVATCAGHIQSKIRVAPDEENQKQYIVGLLLPNSIDFLVAYLGVIYAGHIAMPLDPNFKAMEVQNVISQMNPLFTITNANYKDHFLTSTNTVFVSELDSNESSIDRSSFQYALNPEMQIATMLFTSGTTGNPKAVPYTHANHMWNPAAVSKLWEWTAEDTILISLPLSHWHGLVMGVDGALYHGNTMYIQDWFSAEETVKMLQSGKISLFMHVPIAYQKLVEYANKQLIDISAVRLCISGSSYLPPRLWKEFQTYYKKDILERYGANEMGLLTSNTLGERIPGCVGKPLKDVTIRIEDDGQIAMQSPGLFAGYYNNEEATDAQRTADGMWLSGDLAELDEEGRVHHKGRVQEKMKKFGYTVSPRDVEWALEQHPKVKEVAVVSIQKEESLSDDFVYFVVGDITDKEITEFAKSDMPSFWRPDKIIHLDAIPRTGRTSKPAVKELKKMVSE
jgi:acyl-CoA synthetase (AMP-forming)/AMP-acid ligase II